MKTESADVLIIGAGPAGLLLSQLLHQNDISSIIVERTSKERVLSRIRAGVLERGTVEAMHEADCASRLEAERVDHDGVILSFNGEQFEIPIKSITGHHVTVYGQTEITADLINACEARGQQIYWNCPETRLSDLQSDSPRAALTTPDDAQIEISAKLIAGCDGYLGISRQSIPNTHRKEFQRNYPFGWMGVLVDKPPISHHVIYANHKDGFALASMRSDTRSRYYVQSSPGETTDDWPMSRFWPEFKNRLGQAGDRVITGEPLEVSIAPLRSFVAENMRYERLFLAGDAAHIVPPTGAKGLNLAVADVRRLARAMAAWAKGDETLLHRYADDALARVWKVERFSWYLTTLMHQFPEHSEFEKRMQHAEFEYIVSSDAAQLMIAENYVGLDY